MKSSEMEKSGGVPPIVLDILAGVIGAGGADAIAYNGKYGKDTWDIARGGNLLFNALLAGGGRRMLARGISGKDMVSAGLGLGMISEIPIKDVAFKANGVIGDVSGAMQTSAKAQKDTADALKSLAENSGKDKDSSLSWVLGALGLGALGLGGYGLYRWLNKEDKNQSKMRIKLPGVKGDPDSGAEVELPINPAKISPGLMSRINSTVLRRTRSNVRYAAKKVDPETGKKIPYEEWVMKYGDEDDREALRQELTETGDQQGNIDAMVEDLNTPLPPGDPRLKEASYIPPAFAAALRKAAGFEEAEEIVDDPELQKQVMEEEEKGKTRAKHESRGFIWGNAPGYIGGALLGGMIGDSVIGGDTGGLIGAGAGTLLGGLLPWEIGLFAGAHAEPRTREEQEEHDKGTPWPEYVIPGYAAYQMMRRQRSKKKKSEHEKKASREGHEFLGSTLSSFPASILSALGGAYLAENTGVDPIIGRVIGGGLGAFLPALIGGGLAHVGEERTPEEQAEHDKETPWMEYLIPGYATYQQNKRNQAERIEKERWRERMESALGNASYEATGQKMPPSFSPSELSPVTLPLDELISLRKEGGMMPPPPPPPQGGMMPPPPPPPQGGMMPPSPPPQGNQTRIVDPNQNSSVAGLPKPGSPDTAADWARSAMRKVDTVMQRQSVQTQGQPQRPQGIAGVRSTMQQMGERLRNMRARRYNA